MFTVPRTSSAVLIAVLLFSLVESVICQAQDDKKPAGSQPISQDTDVKKQLQDIEDYLKAQQKDESEFGLVLGIGSLITNPNVTDYQNQSNVLNVAHLGHAIPQFLTGVSFRTKVPTLFTRFRCDTKATVASATKDTCKDKKGSAGLARGEIWQRNPWSAFLALKFAPGASNPINGYVLGGSFAIAHHLAAVVGFALTPVSEPSPGFRSVAAQFVTAEQKQGLYMNFDPTAMLKNGQNAFDGFPLTNPTSGALIYPGNALATHYRGGVVIGVTIPVAFSSFLKGGGAAPPGSANTNVP